MSSKGFRSVRDLEQTSQSVFRHDEVWESHPQVELAGMRTLDSTVSNRGRTLVWLVVSIGRDP